MGITVRRSRLLSVAAFSLLFTYLLSFLFEGQVMYDLMAYYGAEVPLVVTLAMTAHLVGLFVCGYFTKSPGALRKTTLAYAALCVPGSAPFFFAPCPLWLISGLICGFAAGCAVASWGYFFKTLSSKAERLKTCADCLAGTYLLLFFIKLVSNRISPFLGLSLATLCLFLGALCVWRLWLPAGEGEDDEKRETVPEKRSHDLSAPLGVLCAFIIIITINAGLMYSVVNPAFAHLSRLTSWYVILPYIAALFTVRRLSNRTAGAPRSALLYAGMGLLMLSFVAFMLTDRSVAAYLGVATFMVFAFGIFDLFWWSVLGDMLDFTDNPVRVFGAGLAANVLGVLLGRLIGQGFAAMKLSSANITVTALVAVCVGLAILPPLNHRLLLLLKSHAYLTAYWELQEKGRPKAVTAIQPLDPLTEREKEILRLILEGKSNRVIAAESFVTENTVKTHLKNIYIKFEVSSRAELISLLLRNQGK